VTSYSFNSNYQGGSVAEWLACWTASERGLASLLLSALEWAVRVTHKTDILAAVELATAGGRRGTAHSPPARHLPNPTPRKSIDVKKTFM